DVSAPVHGDAAGEGERPVPAAGAAPRGEEGPGVRELLDAGVILVGDEDVSAPVHGDAGGGSELPVPVARAAPRGEEAPSVRELVDAVVDDLDVADPRHAAERGQAERPVP